LAVYLNKHGRLYVEEMIGGRGRKRKFSESGILKVEDDKAWWHEGH
jgi:hypothetical protein